MDSLDFTEVSFLELGKSSVGKIRWNQTVSLAEEGEELDVDSNLSFAPKKVSLDSSKLSRLNTPALITLYNITFTNPKILKDGALCATCTINSFANGAITFTVQGFSVYEVVEGEVAPVITPEAPALMAQVQSTGTNVSTRSSGTSPAPAYGCTPGAIFSTATGQRCPAAASSAASGSLQSATFARNLSLGMSGPDVRNLQRFLNSSGFPVAASGPGSAGSETLTFGPATKAALARYQRDRGISPAAGYFGPVTRNSVGSVSGEGAQGAAASETLPAASQSAHIGNLAPGSSGPAVKALRVRLREAGYLAPYGSASDVPASASAETGTFGATTESAVRKFQCDKSIVCTGSAATTGWGTVGPRTRAALGI